MFVGSGDCFDEMRELASRLGLDGRVTFTGRIPDDELLAYLSTADVALSPDPAQPAQRRLDDEQGPRVHGGRPSDRVVRAPEARVSAGDAARYVACNDTDAFAAATSALLDDPAERRWRGRIGQDRVAGALNWDHSKVQLLASYSAAMAMGGDSPEPSAESPARQDSVPVRL